MATPGEDARNLNVDGLRGLLDDLVDAEEHGFTDDQCAAVEAWLKKQSNFAAAHIPDGKLLARAGMRGSASDRPARRDHGRDPGD